MAGGANITSDKSWSVAGWVFRYLTAELVRRLPPESSLAQEVESARNSGLNWLRVDRLNEGDKALFDRVVREINFDLNRKTAADFSTAQGFEGLKKQLGELVDLLGQ